jgi:hypothetical protein
MDNFLISCWGGIPKKHILNEDGSLNAGRFKEIKEAGINLVPICGYGVEQQDHKTVCEELSLCHELGLKAQLADNRILRALSEKENRERLLADVVRDYSAYPALFSYYVTDEPRCEAFENVADVCHILERLDPAHETYVNILGNRAYEPFWGCKTYDEHLTRYMETVKPSIISYDNYHFKKGAPADENDKYFVEFDGIRRKKVDLHGFIDNMEEVLAYSKRYGVPFMTVILVLEHVDYRNLTEAELRYEVFTSLCYGVKRISYFTYWEPYGDRDPNWEHIIMLNMRGSMIERSGEKSVHYTQISRINRELQALGDILMPYEVKEVFHIGDDPVNSKLKYKSSGFGDITSVNADFAALGFFEGGFVLAVNKDYENGTTVTFAAAEGKQLKHYNKKTGIWEEFDGKLEIGAGDGELIRVE